MKNPANIEVFNYLPRSSKTKSLRRRQQVVTSAELEKRPDREGTAQLSTPTNLLATEIRTLREDLRCTMRAYSARLELALAESAQRIATYEEAGNVPREQLQQIRDLLILLRKRKVKPEKGRRKGLRRIDDLIWKLHAVTHPLDKITRD